MFDTTFKSHHMVTGSEASGQRNRMEINKQFKSRSVGGFCEFLRGKKTFFGHLRRRLNIGSDIVVLVEWSVINYSLSS